MITEEEILIAFQQALNQKKEILLELHYRKQLLMNQPALCRNLKKFFPFYFYLRFSVNNLISIAGEIFSYKIL